MYTDRPLLERTWPTGALTGFGSGKPILIPGKKRIIPVKAPQSINQRAACKGESDSHQAKGVSVGMKPLPSPVGRK